MDRESPLVRAEHQAIDKSALTLPEPRRVRDRDHVRLVAQKACLICGRQPLGLASPSVRAKPRDGTKGLATSSPSHCVAGTIASCTARATRRHGGSGRASTRTLPARALWLESHPLLQTGESMATMHHRAEGEPAKPELRNEAN